MSPQISFSFFFFFFFRKGLNPSNLLQPLYTTSPPLCISSITLVHHLKCSSYIYIYSRVTQIWKNGHVLRWLECLSPFLWHRIAYCKRRVCKLTIWRVYMYIGAEERIKIWCNRRPQHTHTRCLCIRSADGWDAYKQQEKTVVSFGFCLLHVFCFVFPQRTT